MYGGQKLRFGVRARALSYMYNPQDLYYTPNFKAGSPSIGSHSLQVEASKLFQDNKLDSFT